MRESKIQADARKDTEDKMKQSEGLSSSRCVETSANQETFPTILHHGVTLGISQHWRILASACPREGSLMLL